MGLFTKSSNDKTTIYRPRKFPFILLKFAANSFASGVNLKPFDFFAPLAALDLAYQSSPDKARLDAENVQRAKEGKSPIQTTAGGLNYFHTVTDPNTGITTRDFNYSSDGQYRGPIPDEFKNKPGNPNTHDAHFNKETGKWEAGDLSITQTFRDISKGFSDAYTNIGNTLPLMGKEVVNAVFKAPPVVKSSGGKNR